MGGIIDAIRNFEGDVSDAPNPTWADRGCAWMEEMAPRLFQSTGNSKAYCVDRNTGELREVTSEDFKRWGFDYEGV